MGARWRRPFCTSVRRDPDYEPSPAKRSLSPRICAKFGGLFPSKPDISTPTLRCRTNSGSPKKTVAPPPRPCTPPPFSSAPKEAIPSRLLRASSEPSSPKSPSRFALLKASLRLSRSRCGVCVQSVKSREGSAAVFTAECSHTFHLACIAARGSLVCPVCSATWRSNPLLSSVVAQRLPASQSENSREAVEQRKKPHRRREGESKSPADAKVYDDDEPLLHSSNNNRFNPIPEADDEDDDENESILDKEGSSFNRYCPSSPGSECTADEANGGVEVSVVSEAAMVSAGRSHRSYVVAIKVKAPKEFRDGRAPIDLVTVLDVRGSMTGAKLQMLKRAMRQLIASLGPEDRLSIVAFSSIAAKRLLSLHRMSRQGQRLASQVIDRLIISTASQGGSGGGAGDALRKAAKILEDRRERNPVATIMLLSDAQQQQQQQQQQQRKAGFAHVDIPIQACGLGQKQQEAEDPNPFMQCVLVGLLSVVMRDVYIHLVFPDGEITSVYSCSVGGSGRAVALGGGGTVRLGDMRAGEERMLLLELKVPAVTTRGGPVHHHYGMTVRCSYRGAAVTQEEAIRCQEQPLLLPPLLESSDYSSSSSSSSSNVHQQQRLRNLFVTTRAVAESRRLAELNDVSTGIHLLSSARTLVLQSSSSSSSSEKHLLVRLEAELAELLQRRQQQQQAHSPSALMSRATASDDGREALTPTSAWRAAERLAKLAIMRKSLNRVSDLHGFENARF